MKRLAMTIAATLMMVLSVSAQRLTGIRAEARYITDMMVAELGLTTAQRNSILNINLTYLNGINSYRDIDSWGWSQRNKQIRRMLSAKQWKRYKAAKCFYRPIGWRDGDYVHNIYARYPQPRPMGHPGPGPGPRKGPRGPHKGPKEMGPPHREFRNNGPEAIHMRRDMRRGAKRGAR